MEVVIGPWVEKVYCRFDWNLFDMREIACVYLAPEHWFATEIDSRTGRKEGGLRWAGLRVHETMRMESSALGLRWRFIDTTRRKENEIANVS